MYDGLTNTIVSRLEQAIKLVYWSGFSDGAMIGFVAGVVLTLVVIAVLRR